jgi:hypothetical protein
VTQKLLNDFFTHIAHHFLSSNLNNMKQFAIKFLAFISLFIIIFITIFITTKNIANKLSFNSNYFRLKNEELIVLGDSHPECAFNDSLINNCSNIANSGESYFYTYLKARKIIENNKQIKTVFIEFNNNQITKEMDISWTWDDIHLQERLPGYYPYMDYSDFGLLWMKNSEGVLNSLSESLIKNIGHIFLISFGHKKNLKQDRDYGGYLYLVLDKTDSLLNLQKNNFIEENEFEMAETNISYLSKTIEYCNLNHIKVFLIRSPLHPKYTGFSNELKFRKILNSKFANIEFLDFKDFPLQNYEFGDLEHLNYKGAKIFSIFFNRLLNLDLLKKDNKQEFINDEIVKKLTMNKISCSTQ